MNSDPCFKVRMRLLATETLYELLSEFIGNTLSAWPPATKSFVADGFQLKIKRAIAAHAAEALEGEGETAAHRRSPEFREAFHELSQDLLTSLVR